MDVLVKEGIDRILKTRMKHVGDWISDPAERRQFFGLDVSEADVIARLQRLSDEGSLTDDLARRVRHALTYAVATAVLADPQNLELYAGRELLMLEAITEERGLRGPARLADRTADDLTSNINGHLSNRNKALARRLTYLRKRAAEAEAPQPQPQPRSSYLQTACSGLAHILVMLLALGGFTIGYFTAPCQPARLLPAFARRFV